ncbi:MAG: PIG-L family deacetylase [Verrucomicrobiota bacterium]
MPDEHHRTGTDLVYRLRSLPVAANVLIVGAHPDDEENGLLALLTRHHGSRAVYWSATRGEGGQSRIAPYTGADLGVFRTWESLAARELDGGECLFGPFCDYDFSKNGDEALEKWGAARLVGELVRAIRMVQPQIVVSRWRGDASDGHGHHAAVGTAVKEAFVAAGDGRRFSEFERIGLPPWQPRKLYQSMMKDWQPGEKVELGVLRPDLEQAGCLRVNTGGFDPVARLTFQEQGALALNEHLTQGAASVPTPGDYYLYFRLADVAPGLDLSGSIGLFEGIDPTLSGLADYPGGGAAELRHRLEEIEAVAGTAATGFRLEEPWRVTGELLELVRHLGELETALGGLGLSASAHAALGRYLSRKRFDAQDAAAGCLGLRLDASLDRAHLTPGDSGRVKCRLWNFGPEMPARVEFTPCVNLEGADVRRADGSDDPLAAEFEVTAPPDAELSSPYWLRTPPNEYSYEWNDAAHAGLPFDPPLIELTCTVGLGENTLEILRPVLHPEFFAGGYRELAPAILPPISLTPSDTRRMLRLRDVPQVLELSVAMRAHDLNAPITGAFEVQVPEGWGVEPANADVSFKQAGDADRIAVSVTVPPHAAPGAHAIRFGIRCSERLYEASMTAVMQTAPGLGGEPDDGTCIRKQFIARPSVIEVDVIDVNVHEGRYGYVTGTGDDLPQLLGSLGLSVDSLSDDALTHAELGIYDTIVIGPNAFLVRDALRRAARRLLAYVHAGGTLLVQYQGYAHGHMSATPFPFRYSEPHDRVTFETAPVRILQPDHVLFNFPNTIGADDFSGWVRDRGMYFFGEWDDHYEPLLACADPGESEKLGGLLVASYGRGTYIYCGYTIFRQLAAGVQGGFRLFSNLLALPEGRVRRRMEHLQDVSIFEPLDEHDLHRVAEITDELWLGDGEYVFHEGEEGAEFYVVEAGGLDVLQGDQEQLIGSCERGEPIGELAAFTGLRRKASLRARGRTHLFVVRSDDFLGLLREEPDIGERMIRLLARRLSAALEAAPPAVEGGPLARVYE